VSFATPLWLLALALLPIAVAAARWRHRCGDRYVIRHPATATVRAALAATPRWPRHVPAALLLAAVALIVIALARPRVSHRVPTDSASLMLVSDHSGSMAADDVRPTRLAAAISAANAFIDRLPASVRVGAIGFSTVPDSVQGPTLDHAAARRVIDAQRADGGTDTGDALELALRLLDGAAPHHPPAAIVLLSDGAANAGPNPLAVSQTAAREHIPIYTVALGTPSGVVVPPNGFGPAVAVPPDPQLMREIAKLSHARAFDARSADELGSIYTRLGTELSTVTRPRDITIVFIIAAAAVLLVVGAASVARGARLP
jgi:Ca-activated chloride channel family protein